MKQCFLCTDFYTVELCRKNPDTIYVFGDNSIREGKGGQAIIRDEPNAFGIMTKLLPTMNEDAFLKDYHEYWEMVLNDVKELKKIIENNPNVRVAFPSTGLGTGLAKLNENAPKIAKALNKIIEEMLKYY